MLRRVVVVLVVLACAAGVVGYQVSRPARAPANPKVFVPSPKFFQDFSPSFRTSIADAYYLMMVQYYGEHVNGDGKLDSLPAMAELVTTLSPHFTRAYLFSAFALIDAGRPDVAYELLKKGFKENPDDWHFPAYLGLLRLPVRLRVRTRTWWRRAGTSRPRRSRAAPTTSDGSPPRSSAKGGEQEKAILMLGQAYLAGDKYARQKAVTGLEYILPKEKGARMKAVAPLYNTMPKAEFDALIAELFKGYQ